MLNYMDCPICLKHINDIELSITNCNHNFCYTCLNNWFQKNKKTCPMCRENINYFKYDNEINRIIYINPVNQSNNTPNPNTNNYVVVDKNKFILLQAISTTSIIFIGSTIYLLIEGNFL
ncbi:MAG: hypothetical protein CMG74_06835 [Candidatus Marinimicrobia bacterium]|nr:hypothetical protein [Candidatus Neomarinimicrobiota bacterium]